MEALFITGSNQYGVVSHFLHGMMNDLSQLNVLVHELNVASELKRKETELTLDSLDSYDFILSFNGVGLDLTVGGVSISSRTTKCPVFVFLVDHPLHLISRFIGMEVTVLCIDKEHVAFCKLCSIKAIYFPHAVSNSDLTRYKSLKLAAKSDEVIYPVSYFDLDLARQRLQPVWHQIGKIVEQSSNVTRFLQYLGVLPNGNKPSSVALDENIRRISVLVDMYLRAKTRKEFMFKCQENGIVLTVIGKHSEKYNLEFSEHIYESALPFRDLLDRIRQARFVAHNSPGFELGLHERVVIPLALGTRVFSDMPYVSSSFGNAIATTSNDLVTKPEMYELYVQEAQSKIRENHTWLKQWMPLIASINSKN